MLRLDVLSVVLLTFLVACGGSSDTGPDASLPSDAATAPGPDGAAPPGDGGAPGPTDAGADAGATCLDVDRDGVTDCAGDCDDADPLTHPGATEVCGDGVDNDCGSDPDPASLCGALGTHVSPAGSDATGDGTRDNPVRSIAQGIANAVTIGGATTVVVAGGDYAESVTMVEGVSVQGGFACAALPCSWRHDPATEVSAIAVSGTADGVLVDDTITRGTALEDVTVTSEREGIAVRGGAPTIRRVEIVARRGISAYGAGTDPLIEDCVVVATRTGIEIEGSGVVRRCDVEGARGVGLRGDPVLEESVVHGTADSAVAVWEGAPRILANLIDPDAARVGTCDFGFCSGIQIWGGSPYIANNVVFGMGGTQSSAIGIVHGELLVERPIINSNTLFMAGNAASGSVNAGISCESFFGLATFGEIRNNIVVGASRGTSHVYYEVDPSDPATTCRPVLIENNVAHDIDHFARFYGGGTEVLFTRSAAEMEDWARDNVEADPMLDASHHLMAGSPAIDRGVATDAPGSDRDGDPRPAGGGFDVGADEVTP